MIYAPLDIDAVVRIPIVLGIKYVGTWRGGGGTMHGMVQNP